MAADSLPAFFGPPARRAARGPVRGCRPSEAPSALPPDDPAGLSIFQQPSKPHLHSLRPILLGFPGPTSLRGLRVFCCGSFPPFGRVISLRAAQYHRPLSPCTKAVGTSTCLKGFLLLIFACWCLLVQAVNAPAAFARGLLAFEGFILAARECDFWQGSVQSFSHIL